MTELERHEISQIVTEAIAAAMAQSHHCPRGIKPETAHELISFAETWKTCRKVMISGVIATAIGGLLAALWSGFKLLIRS